MATLRLKNGSSKIIKAGTLVRYNPDDKKSFIATTLEEADVIGVLSTATSPNGIGIIELLGTTSSNTTTGTNGKSAYELAVAAGFVGSVGAWLLSLKGKDGVDGHTPIKGVDYFDGSKGDKGDTGSQGPQGIQGIQGVQGNPGTPGANGSDATVTKVAVESVLTGEITSHSHAGSGLTQQQIMRLQ